MLTKIVSDETAGMCFVNAMNKMNPKIETPVDLLNKRCIYYRARVDARVWIFYPEARDDIFFQIKLLLLVVYSIERDFSPYEEFSEDEMLQKPC